MEKTSEMVVADLFLDVDVIGSGRSKRQRLEAAIRAAIEAGRLLPGNTLPPSRVLAAQLGCSRWVVVEAYEQLTSEGVLRSQRGSGTEVALGSVVKKRRSLNPMPEPPRINFSAAAPDLTAFPRTEWSRATAHVMATVTPRDLAYCEPNGIAEFRTVLSDRLSRIRGVRADPPDVVVSSGTVQAVSLLAMALRRSGHTAVAVEDPGWTRLRRPLEEAGLRIVPVAVDSDGLRVSDLASAAEVRAVLTTPAHQFPTGVVMASDRRADLLAWARDRDGLIVEDDYDAEFRYDRRPVGTLQAIAPDHVAYIGSASKILSPALRMGWMVLPERFGSAVAALRSGYDLGISVLEQLCMAHLMRSGVLDRYLRRSRTRYGKRLNVLLTAVEQHLPAARISGVAAGLHVVMRLPRGTDEHTVVKKAAERGVKVLGMAQYCVKDHAFPDALVLGYAGLSERAIIEGIRVLAQVV